MLFVGCLTSQQQASVSQLYLLPLWDRSVDQTFYLTRSQYTDNGPFGPSADSMMPDTWQGSYWSASLEVTGMTRPGRSSMPRAGIEPNVCRSWVCLFVGCLTSRQHASVSQGPICSDNFTCCPTEIELADQTFHLTQSQYTTTVPTSPSTDPITPGAWQGSHWSANF